MAATLTYVFANNANARLGVDVAAAATGFVVPAGEGAKFPAPGANDRCMITVEDRRTGALEIMRLTARSTDTFTVVRAQEGTSAQDFVAGATVSNRMTAGTLAHVQANNLFYLGAFTAAPTLGSTGPLGQQIPDVLTTGMLYFNTTSSKMFVWNGTVWADYTDALPIDGSAPMQGNLQMGDYDILFTPNVPGERIIEGGGGTIENAIIEGGTW